MSEVISLPKWNAGARNPREDLQKAGGLPINLKWG